MPKRFDLESEGALEWFFKDACMRGDKPDVILAAVKSVPHYTYMLIEGNEELQLSFREAVYEKMTEALEELENEPPPLSYA